MRNLYRYEFGVVVFDEARHELLIDRRPVRLQARLAKLLSYLLARSCTAVGRDDLLDQVWGLNSTAKDHALTAAIERLRQLLGADGDYLKTVRGKGYCLDVRPERTIVGTDYDKPLALEVGGEVPARPGWRLAEVLGRSQSCETWRAQQPPSGRTRVFKFAADVSGLKELRREARLHAHVVHTLGERAEFVQVLSTQFEAAPFFIEMSDGGSDLGLWRDADPWLSTASSDQIIAFFLRIADAVAVLHRVPLIHADLKPANILVTMDAGEPAVVKLIDLGSGVLVAGRVRERVGAITESLTIAGAPADPTRGTFPYFAPELWRGSKPDVRSDIFSLGVLLFQLSVRDFSRRPDTGWQREIDDPLLIDDLQHALDGDPLERFASVEEFARQLRQLPARREARALAEQVKQETAQLRAQAARVAARRPWVISLLVLMTTALAAVGTLYVLARQARDDQAHAYAIVDAMSRLFVDDFIRAADPSIGGQRNLTVAAAAAAAAPRIDGAFGAQDVRVRVALHVAMLRTLVGLQEFREAVVEGQRTVGLLTAARPPDSQAIADTRLLLALALRGVGRVDEAAAELDRVQALLTAEHLDDGELPVRLAQGRALVAANRSDMPGALAFARKAWQIVTTSRRPLPATVRDEATFLLADVERVNGHLVEAERIDDILLAERTAAYGAADWRTCFAQAHLSGILQGQHRDAEALDMLAPAEHCIDRALGPDAPQAILAFRVRGNVYNDLGHYREAAAARGEAARRAVLLSGELSAVALSEHINQATALSLAGDSAACRAAADHVIAVLLPARTGVEADIQEARFLAVDCRLDLHERDGVSAMLNRALPESLYKAERWPSWRARLDYERARLAAQEGDRESARRLIAEAAELMQRDGYVDPVFASRISRVRIALEARPGMPSRGIRSQQAG